MDYVVTRDGRLRLWTTLRRVAPEAVFAYWCDGDKRAQWWPEGEGLTPSDTEPGRRLAFDLPAGAQSPYPEGQVVVDFERRDDDTLITVTQGPVTDETQQSLLETWTRALGRLKGALERSSPMT